LWKYDNAVLVIFSRKTLLLKEFPPLYLHLSPFIVSKAAGKAGEMAGSEATDPK
jgi:hypothetical protein